MQSTKQVRDKFVTKFVAFGYLFFFLPETHRDRTEKLGCHNTALENALKKFQTLLLAIELMGRKKEKKKEISEVT